MLRGEPSLRCEELGAGVDAFDVQPFEAPLIVEGNRDLDARRNQHVRCIDVRDEVIERIARRIVAMANLPF